MTHRPDRSSKISRSSQEPAHSPPPLRPLVPHPRLFYALLVIFILWIGALLAMYFTTVYHKTDVHVEGATTQAQSEKE